MPLNDLDLDRRRCSAHWPADDAVFILYSYNETIFDEKTFHSVHELLDLLKTDMKNSCSQPKDTKYYWIEVINSSSVDMPISIQILCEYFQIHPLTIEDIGTLAPYMKLDLFPETKSIYLVMKMLTWIDQRVQQQQISFYLNCSQNLLITFQEKSTKNSEHFFETIRNRLRKQQTIDEHIHQHKRLRQFNVDYLFYCLLDNIVDR